MYNRTRHYYLREPYKLSRLPFGKRLFYVFFTSKLHLKYCQTQDFASFWIDKNKGRSRETLILLTQKGGTYMIEVEKDFASKGVAGAGLGLGIAGTALGLMNGNGLGGLFCGWGNCNAGCG
jgi:hypothetical protein